MPNKPARQFAALRQTDFTAWQTTLWLVKRRLAGKNAQYSVFRVDTDEKLKTKLKKTITDRIQNKHHKLEEYSFVSSDQDEHIYTMDTSENDFTAIQNEIEKGLQNKKVEKYDDLLNSWAYVVKLENNGSAVYGFRKISVLNQAKKVNRFASLLFQNDVLMDLDEKKVFTIATDLDFFSYDGTTFITNKKDFESALNFRKGMEDNRDNVLAEFETLKIFSSVDAIRKTVGSNLHFLRKISAIQKSGYFRDKSFLQDLIKINAEKGWGLVIENGSIIVTEENVDLVLTLLNNSRLESPINHEVFDAAVKKKVA